MSDVEQHDVDQHDVEQLSCREVVELVTAYLEGALSREEHVRFETHLAACRGCVAYLEQMRATIRLTGTLRVEDIPADTIMAGLPWGWESYGDYLATLGGSAWGVNVGGLIGHCALRYDCRGDRARDEAPATDDDIA